MNNLYLWVNFFSLVPTLLFSFHPKIKFYRNWKFALPAIVITMLVFVVWDMYYTKIGVWGFNPKYITGYFFGNLPIEELLFFICIPYACMYTYHCFKLFVRKDYFKPIEKLITIFISVFLVLLSLKYPSNYYTTVVFILLSIVLILLQFIVKANWLSKFYFTYTLLLIPFLIVNGILTGTGLDEPVVWYNENEIIGLRILTIPIEDIFYGMLMLISSVAIYERLKQ